MTDADLPDIPPEQRRDALGCLASLVGTFLLATIAVVVRACGS